MSPDQTTKLHLLASAVCFSPFAVQKLADLYSILSGAAARNNLFSTWRLACPATANQSGPMDGRYGLYLKIAQDYAHRLKNAPKQFQGKAKLGDYPIHYTIEYPSDKGPLLLTSFKSDHFAGNRIAKWDHTSPSQMKDGLSVMAPLLEEIRSMKGATPAELREKNSLVLLGSRPSGAYSKRQFPVCP